MLAGIGAALIGLAWLLPGHYFPWLTFQQEFAAALGAVLIGLDVLVRCPRVHWTAPSYVALIAAAVPLIQFGFGQIHYLSDAAMASGYLAGFALCIVAGATLGRLDAALLDALTYSAVAASIVCVGMALTQWLQLPPTGWIDPLRFGGRPYANVGQPNNLASIIAIGMICLLRCFELRRIGGVTLLLGACYLGLGMVLTQSRTGWLVFALCVAWLTLGRKAPMRLHAAALAGALATFSGLMFLWGSVNEAIELAGPGEVSARLSGGTRPVHWVAMWDAALRHPWTGFGWTQVTQAHLEVALDHPYTGEQLTNSHNLFLDLLVWNGIPIGALLIAAMVFWIVRQVLICRATDHAIALCIVIAVGTHALLEFPLDYAFFLLPLGLWVGLIDAQSSPFRERTSARWVFAVPLAALAALQLRVGIEYLRVEEAGRTLRFVVFGIGLDKVPTAPEPEVWLLDRSRHFHRYMLSRAAPNLTLEERQWIERVAQRNPSPSSLFRLAVVQGINGEPEASARTLARLCWVQAPPVCAAARDEWLTMQERFPLLKAVSPPPMPGTQPNTPSSNMKKSAS